MGSYKVHTCIRSVPYHNHRSAQRQFGEVESRSSPDAQLCTAVNGVQRNSEIKHLNKAHLKKSLTVQVYIVKGKFTPLHIAVRLALLFALHFLNHRTSVSLRSCANAEGYGELSFVFIESKLLAQQLGLALYSAARRSAVAQCANA